jgi:glutathione S-transferase
MQTALKPITLFTHKAGPNGWKAAILFQELGVPYKSKFLEFGNGVNGVKHADFLKIVISSSDYLLTI